MAVNYEPPQQPPLARVHQVPEWEQPSRPPKRSLFDRLAGTTPGVITPINLSRPTSRDVAIQKEFSRAPTQSMEFDIEAKQPSRTRTRIRERFDALVPPHRTYFGRSRRVFLFLAILPLLLIILILAVGLGVGLRNSNNNNSSQHLPLPVNPNGVYTGDLTYYGLGLGACGEVNSDTDMVCAVSHTVFDAVAVGSNPNQNPLCGRRIHIMRNDTQAGTGNASVTVTVVDRCVGCLPNDLDLSPAAFDQLAPESAGRVVGSWSWLD